MLYTKFERNRRSPQNLVRPVGGRTKKNIFSHFFIFFIFFVFYAKNKISKKNFFLVGTASRTSRTKPCPAIQFYTVDKDTWEMIYSKFEQNRRSPAFWAIDRRTSRTKACPKVSFGKNSSFSMWNLSFKFEANPRSPAFVMKHG